MLNETEGRTIMLKIHPHRKHLNILTTILTILLIVSGCRKEETFPMQIHETTSPISEESVSTEASSPQPSADSPVVSDLPSLKELYADYFQMGVCINPVTVSDNQYKELICHEFNSVTNENNLKPENIISKSATLADLEGNREHIQLDFTRVIPELDFAVRNHLKVRGHTLIWHSQTPDWIFYKDYDPSGEPADRELMLKRMENYIHDVFSFISTNYPDLFYAFDIANECVDDNGGMRDSLWRKTIGDDYLNYAFSYARTYAPEEILLFYNDYNTYQPAKQADIINLLSPVAEAGNLDGIGMQSHLDTDVSPARFTFAAQKYADELHVVIHITELDIVQPDAGNPEKIQGLYYKRFFDALVAAKKNGTPIESVSVWGLTDGLSWKSDDHPLLFHSDLTPKDCFYEITSGEAYTGAASPEIMASSSRNACS